MMTNKIIQGDALEELKKLPDESVDMVVTSPPYYGLRDYDKEEQIGLENTLEEYLQRLLAVTKECQRVLKEKGTLWWVHGDSYGAGKRKTNVDDSIKRGKETPNRGVPENHRAQGYAKSLLMQPYRLARRMIDEQGWILRNIIIWHKPSCMPSSVKDRFTVDFEPMLFFSKNKKYYFEQQFEPMKEKSRERFKRVIEKQEEYNPKEHKTDKSGKAQSPYEILTRASENLINAKGRNKRTTWSINPEPHNWEKELGIKGIDHFAVFPEELIETPIRAGCPKRVCKKCGEPQKKEYKVIARKKAGGSRKNDTAVNRHIIRDHKTQPTKIEPIKKTCNCNAEFKSGTVLDPFMGAGTTAVVARKLGRDWLGIELNKEYIKIAEQRIKGQTRAML